MPGSQASDPAGEGNPTGRIPPAALKAFVETGKGSDLLEARLARLGEDYGFVLDGAGERAARAVAALTTGALPDQVSGLLGWRDFEGFCAAVLRAKGYSVHENLVLTKPRMQVDLLARSRSLALVVDCKHWGHAGSPSTCAAVGGAQARRALALRSKNPGMEPMMPVILVLTPWSAPFAGGAAIVPVQSLSGFLDQVESHLENVELL